MTKGAGRTALAVMLTLACLAAIVLRWQAVDPAAGPSLRLEGDRLSANGSTEALASASEKYLGASRSFSAAGDMSGEVESRLSLGSVFERLGDVESALVQYDEAVVTARRAGSALLVARSANRLGALSHQVGNLEAARALGGEALDAAEDAGSEEQRSEAFYNIASLQYSLGAMREAIRHFESSAEAALRAGDVALEARAQLQIGMTATMMEQRDRARTALSISLSLSGALSDARAQADALRALGQLHSRLGEAQRALERFEEARRILAPLDDKATEATILNGLGQVYFDLGEKETALRHYQQALELNQRLRFRRREASTLLEIGRCELDLGRGGDARERFLEALAIYRSLQNRRLEGDVLVELGRLHESLGEYESAIDFFDQAIALKLQSGDARGRAYTLYEAGSLQEKLGKHETALSQHRDAARLSAEADDPLGESLALYGMARAQQELGILSQARASIERSLDLVETLRAKVASHGLRTSFFASIHERYAFYVDLLMRLHRANPADGFDAMAFQAAERARARTLAESLTEAAAGIREGIDPELLAEERSLRERINDAAMEQSLLPPDSDPALARALSNEISTLAFEYDRLQSTIRSRSPRYSSLTQPGASSLEEVQQSLLDEDTQLLAYSLGTERSFLWSVTRERYAVYELPARAEIEELARSSHSRLKSPRPPAEPENDIDRLSRILIEPIEGLGDSKRILVVADGALGRVPFAVLRDRTGAALLESFEVVRLPAASVLPILREQRRHRTFTKWAAVAADPAYEPEHVRIESRSHSAPQARSFNVARLPSSRSEALAIQALAPPGAVDVVMGSDASREWVTGTEFQNYRALHFATHAVADDEHPELSGIVLSLVDERGNPRDGFLRLHDVYNLHLPVDLVVLSACETGLGKEVRGEGLLGLVRGFMYAGAPAVVASSWKVDDNATSELMTHFYRSYFGGATPAAALREAQLALSRTKRFRRPYYWAAFELQGDWR